MRPRSAKKLNERKAADPDSDFEHSDDGDGDDDDDAYESDVSVSSDSEDDGAKHVRWLLLHVVQLASSL